MKIEAHILGFNEEKILTYTFRNYQAFCSRVVLHDLGSSDGSLELAKKMGVEVRKWDCGGEFNDELNKHIKDVCWHGTTFDWGVCVDADELLFFPEGAKKSFEDYEQQKLIALSPHGFEMVSDKFPTTTGQIYEEVKMGARDDVWYNKPVCFSKRRVAVTDFGMGAHQVRYKTHAGHVVEFNGATPKTTPPCFVLHCHHLGTVEEIGAKYEGVISRLSATNRKMGWGIQRDGLQHSRDKRKYIMDRLEKVIP